MRGHDQLGRAAQTVLANRRSRSQLLPTTLFGEWAWDALLTLFVADAEGTRKTGRMIASEVSCSPKVMAKWVQHLSQVGLVVGDGSGDLDDPLTLSPEAMLALETYLTATLAMAREFA